MIVQNYNLRNLFWYTYQKNDYTTNNEEIFTGYIPCIKSDNVYPLTNQLETNTFFTRAQITTAQFGLL